MPDAATTDEAEPKRSRCRAGAPRCDFRGTRDELHAHAEDVGHPRCILCGDALAGTEQQTCIRCEVRVRDDLNGVAAAHAQLERRIADGAYAGGWLPALTMAGDGAMAGGGEDDHVRYRDPWVTVAVLEAHDRDWRETFGHPMPTYRPLGHPDRLVRHVLAECLAYLRANLHLAAQTHPGFDDYANEIHVLRSKVEHVVGLADDPLAAPATCFDCGGQLLRTYRVVPDDQARTAHRRLLAAYRAQALLDARMAAAASRSHLARRAAFEAGRAVEEPRAGRDPEGLTDDWTCRGCGRVYDQASYFLAVRARREECRGWVPVRLAADVLRQPQQTVWWWQQRMDVPSVCSIVTRKILVDWAEVADRAARLAERRKRKSA